MPKTYTLLSIRKIEAKLIANPIEIKTIESTIAKDQDELKALGAKMTCLSARHKKYEAKYSGAKAQLEINEKNKAIDEFQKLIAEEEIEVERLLSKQDRLQKDINLVTIKGLSVSEQLDKNAIQHSQIKYRIAEIEAELQKMDHERMLRHDQEEVRQQSERYRLAHLNNAEANAEQGHHKKKRAEERKHQRESFSFDANELVIAEQERPIRQKLNDELTTLLKAKQDLDAAASQISSKYLVDQKISNDALKSSESKKRDSEEKLAQLNPVITARQARLSKLKHDAEEYKRKISMLMPIAMEYKQFNDAILEQIVLENKGTFEKLSAEKVQLQSQIQQHEKAIAHPLSIISTLKSELDQLSQDEFLNQLRKNPQAYLKALHEKMLYTISEYDRTHCFNQSEPVRMCLADFERNVKQILDDKQESKSVVSEEQPGNTSLLDNEYIVKSNRLIGFLYRMQERVAYPFLNVEFGRAIDSIVKEPFDREESLQNYKKLGIAETTPKQLADYELQQYQKYYKQLQDFLSAPREGINDSIIQKAKNVVVEIEAARTAPVVQGQPVFDMSLNTRILRRTHELLLSPNNEDLKREYQQLAQHHQKGQRSVGKTIAGAMIIFLSAVCLVVSVAVTAATLGASAPVTGATMALGVLGIGAGCLLFRSGRASGPVLAMNEMLDKNNERKHAGVKK